MAACVGIKRSGASPVSPTARLPSTAPTQAPAATSVIPKLKPKLLRYSKHLFFNLAHDMQEPCQASRVSRWGEDSGTRGVSPLLGSRYLWLLYSATNPQSFTRPPAQPPGPPTLSLSLSATHGQSQEVATQCYIGNRFEIFAPQTFKNPKSLVMIRFLCLRQKHDLLGHSDKNFSLIMKITAFCKRITRSLEYSAPRICHIVYWQMGIGRLYRRRTLKTTP